MNDTERKKVNDWITHGMNDPEPQRYYDWILWRLRQEEKMQIKHHPIFQSGYSEIFLDFDNDKLEKIILDNSDKKFSDDPNHTGIEDSGLPPNDKNILELKSTFEEVVTEVINLDENYVVDTISMWGHIIPPNGSTMYHSHKINGMFPSWGMTEPGMSCVYYVNVPENSGDLSFVTNAYGNEHITKVKSETGKLVIFPCYIPHMTGTNKSGKNRLSISANFIVKPKNAIGEKHE